MMKKLTYLSLVLAAALIMVFAMESCVDPVMGDFGPKVIAMKDLPGKMAEYGIADMAFLDSVQNIKPTEDSGGLTINFTGGSEADDFLAAYFDKWTLEASGSAIITEYSRGIANAQVFVSKPSYKIVIAKDPNIPAYWPPAARLAEYIVPDLLEPTGTGITSVSHLVEITHKPNSTDITGFMLSIMIYGSPDAPITNNDIGDYLNHYFDGWYSEVKWNPIEDSEGIKAVREIMGLEDGLDVLPMGAKGYDRGVKAVLITQNAPYYYEVDIAKDIGNGVLGWPPKRKLAKYGLYSMPDPTADYPQAYTIYEDSDDSDDDPDSLVADTGTKALNIRFYGKLDGSTENTVKNFFGGKTWKTEVSDSPGKIFLYNRGIADVSFDTTYKPYYDISVTQDLEALRGWPNDLFIPYGLYGWPDVKPDSANRITYFEDKSDTQTQLYIWFFGPDDPASDITDLFKKWTRSATYTALDNNGVEVELSYPDDILAYSRGPTSVEFSIGASPFYEMAVSWDSNGFGTGWPTAAEVKPYGLLGFNASAPAHTADVRHVKDAEDNLSIMFFDDGTPGNEAAIKTAILTNYFDKLDNHWTRIYEERDDAGNLVAEYPVDSGIYAYTRGITTVIVDTSQDPYYEITISRNPEGAFGWPQDQLKKYGLYGPLADNSIPACIDAVPDEMVTWLAQTDTTTDPNTSTLTIMFYGTTVTGPETDFATSTSSSNPAYFSPTNGWKKTLNYVDDSGNLVSYPDHVYAFDRGISSVVFDGSQQPYYELQVSIDLVQCNPGWPDMNTLKKYGLYGITATKPDGIVYPGSPVVPDDPYLTWLIEDDYTTDPLAPTSALTIRIYATNTTDVEKAIKTDYLSPANHWTPVLTDENGLPYPTGVFAYTRGIADVVFDTSQKPYYELQSTINIENCTKGWPDANKIKEYGLHNLIAKPSGIDDTTLEYYTETDTTPGSPSSTLTLRFYGDGTFVSLLQDYFSTDNHWTPATTDENGLPYPTGVFVYDRGIANVVFDTSQSPYYEIQTTKDTDTDRTYLWPSQAVSESYGLHGLATSALSGIDTTNYPSGSTLSYFSDTSEGNTLNVRFYGDANTETAVKNYFSTNNWTRAYEEYDDLGNLVQVYPPELFVYGRGFASASFDTKEAPYYEIDVDFAPVGTSWTSSPPTSDILTSYKINGITPPAGDTNHITHRTWELTSELDEGTGLPAEELTIRFYATSAEETTVRNWLKTSGWVESQNGSLYEYTIGDAYASLDTTEKQYYELTLDKDGSILGWPKTDVLTRFGIAGMAMPNGSSGVSYNVFEPESAAEGPSLEITFTGTLGSGSTTTLTVVNNYFKNNGWQTETTTSPYTYSKGPYYAEFTAPGSSGSTSMLLAISIDPNMGTGWPVAKVWTDLGLTYIAQPNGTGTNALANIGYSITEEENLKIWFTGSSGTGTTTSETLTRNALKTFFMEKSTASPYEYSRGALEAEFTLFTGSGTTNRYFEIEISKSADAVQNALPTSDLNTYHLSSGTGPILSLPSGAMGYYFTDKGTSTEELTIWFNGSYKTTLDTWLTANGWEPDTATTNPVEYDNTATTTNFAELYSILTSYYELVISK